MKTSRTNEVLISLKNQISNAFYALSSDVTLTDSEYAIVISSQADEARNYLWCLVDQMLYEAK